MQSPLLGDEAARSRVLLNYRILDTPPEERFDDLVRVATYICGTPIGLVDVTAILAWAVRKHAKKDKKDGAFVDSGLIETHLRLAYTGDAFKNTALFKAVRDWEGRNAPYAILL